jgi:hypothetical protein
LSSKSLACYDLGAVRRAKNVIAKSLAVNMPKQRDLRLAFLTDSLLQAMAPDDEMLFFDLKMKNAREDRGRPDISLYFQCSELRGAIWQVF